jgi:hypothetical protein
MSEDLVDIVEVIAEERIRAAMERGEFDNLPGKGRPLNLDDLENVPLELRAAYTLLRNAGFAPPEVELRKEIAALEARLAATVDPAQARALRAQIADKEIVFDVMNKRWRRKR